MILKVDKGVFRKVILNSEEIESLDSLLEDKRFINVVKCITCDNFTTFEDEDIVYIVQNSLSEASYEKGYIKCPWCGNEMYVAERQNNVKTIMTRRYFFTIERKDCNKIMK